MEIAYFRSIFFGDLYFDFSFLDYEDIPIVFICHDSNWNLYLCSCTDFRFTREWTISKTSIDTIQLLFEQEMPIYEALKANSDIKYLVDYEYCSKNWRIRRMKFENIPPTRLPDKHAPLGFIKMEAESEFINLKNKMNKEKRV